MRNLITLTMLALIASTLPALADGKEDTLAVISMTIAQNECGLAPDMASAQVTAERSMAFTGLDRAQYIATMGEMVAFKTNEMYAAKTIGGFCVRMAQIYAGAK